jgi:DNA polymerase-3 subunit beta
MRDLIDATRFAISTEETRYYLNGIYIHKAESGELCAVATDGHRLAMTRQALPSGAAQMPSIILPRKAVSELRKLLDDFDGDFSCNFRILLGEARFVSSNDKSLIVLARSNLDQLCEKPCPYIPIDFLKGFVVPLNIILVYLD